MAVLAAVLHPHNGKLFGSLRTHGDWLVLLAWLAFSLGFLGMTTRSIPRWSAELLLTAACLLFAFARWVAKGGLGANARCWKTYASGVLKRVGIAAASD
jgi:hypothetical protein